MLTGTNNSHLLRKNIGVEHYFLYQRWLELLDARTLDMYQYNILNSYAACAELLDVIEKTLSGLFTSRQNVDDVKAETFDIVKDDDVLKTRDKPLYNTLLRILSTKIESKQRTDTIEEKNTPYYFSLNRLKFQLKTPVRTLGSMYLGYLLQSLKEDVDTRNFGRLERHLSMLISQALQQGWSAKALLTLSSCFEGENESADKWQTFVDKLSSSATTSFEVFYGIRLDAHRGIPYESVKATLLALELHIKKGQEIILEHPGCVSLRSKIHAENIYIFSTVNSRDMYSAALLAINQLNRRISVATFYNAIYPWAAIAPQIVVNDIETNFCESLSITDVFRTYDYIDSNNGVFADTISILNNPQKNEIMSRLHASYSYTNLSRASLFQESKYISLWIAFEAIMRTGQYADIISHIKCALPEILCIRYIYRIVRNFTEDCIRCRYKEDAILGVAFESPDKIQLVRKMISVFRNPTQYATLLGNCTPNELLHYRCQEICKILNDSDNIAEKFRHYTQKVRWHIQRLYRIRNEIAHSAFQEDKSLVIYIEHLYTYLAQLVSEVVFYVEHKGAETIEEAFATIVESYHTYLELMKEGHLTIHDILPDGIISLS